MEKQIFTYDICRQELDEAYGIIMSDLEWEQLQDTFNCHLHQEMKYIIECREDENDKNTFKDKTP